MDKPSKIRCACNSRFAVAIAYAIATGLWTPVCVPHMSELSDGTPIAPLREWCEPLPLPDAVYDHETDGGID